MKNLSFVKPEKVSLKNRPDFNERWVQDRIAEDPSILGLGDVIVRDQERVQPRAGRLDLLLQDLESNHRYEVEIQLGETNESHIIRTIEYWDIERKRYPQYEHTAVIIAEEITSRFLNVINLFNGSIPLVAIQMTAFCIDQNISLLFTTIQGELRLGLIDDDEDVRVVTDRAYWEQHGTKVTVALADEILGWIRTFAPGFELKYNKFYVGLGEGGQPNNFAIFRPQKNAIRLEVRLPQSSELESKLENAGLDVMDYDKKWGRFRLRLTKDDVKKHSELLTPLLSEAYRKTIE